MRRQEADGGRQEVEREARVPRQGPQEGSRHRRRVPHEGRREVLERVRRRRGEGGCATMNDAANLEAIVNSAVAAFVAALPDGGTDEGRTCAASKLGATGKKASGELVCQATATSKGTTVDPLCLGKARDKFEKAFTKADSKGRVCRSRRRLDRRAAGRPVRRRRGRCPHRAAAGRELRQRCAADLHRQLRDAELLPYRILPARGHESQRGHGV